MKGRENIWPKKLTVDKRIVRVLSNQTYDDFPNTLREIIMNSYDADATKVDVRIDSEKEYIEVEDNGKGMSEEDFDFYLRIAGKTRGKVEYTALGRRIVGKFGVGFLSIFPFCERYSIETTKRGTPEVVYADIPCQKYFSSAQQIIDVDEIPIHGGKRVVENLKNSQFTKIRLSGFTNIASAFFKEEYKLENRRNTIYKYSPIDFLKWKLSEDLPLKYDKSKFNKIFYQDEDLNFNVYLNGEKLYRKVYASNVLETHSGSYKQIGKIKFRYFFATDYEPIKPTEGRFIKLRNLNVGVGDRDNFDIGTQTRTFAYIAHITGEVNFIEGMNELIAVSRNQFNFHPDYEKVKNFLRERTTYWLRKIEDIKSFERESEQISSIDVIKNIESLDKNKLEKDISKLTDIGYKVKNKQDSSVNKGSTKQEILVDKENKEIVVSGNFESFSKVLEVNNTKLKLDISSWDIDKSSFQACRKEDGKILINREYPLFKGKKHVDLFVKFHLMLLLALEKGEIKKETYQYFQKNILENFSNYT